MKAINNFLNLFHRKHRFRPEYQILSRLKKIMFFGVSGFVLALSVSKFIQSGLIYSFEPTEQNKLMIKFNPPLERGVYNPSMLMFSGQLQWLYAKYRQQQPYLRTSERQIQGEIVQEVHLHDKATHKTKDKIRMIPLAFVIAGSEGIDNTVRSLMQAIYKLGYRTICINPKDLFDKEKIIRIIETYKKQFPNQKIFGVGVEYGANLLINAAAQNSDLFQGLISIGNPYDLLKSQVRLQNSWMWYPLYRSILQGRLKKGKQLNSKFEGDKVFSLLQVDKQVYNLKDQQLKQWKERHSCINSLSKLKVSTLLIQSNEDPFSTPVSSDQRFQNDKCIYVTTKRGGHTQWFQNLWMNRWFISPIRYFLKIINQDALQEVRKKNQNI